MAQCKSYRVFRLVVICIFISLISNIVSTCSINNRLKDIEEILFNTKVSPHSSSLMGVYGSHNKNANVKVLNKSKHLDNNKNNKNGK
jgi:hypothetical protein